IPELTYEELVAFHRHFYHPSRCLFFFYGNLPLEGHLEFIESHALSNAQPLPPIDLIPQQPRFSEPRVAKAPYPFAASEDPSQEHFQVTSWLTCSVLEQETVLALEVLDAVLMDNDASPLRDALLSSGLCRAASSYLSTETSEVSWAIVCQGCRGENGQAIETLILETLKKIASEGISKEKIESALHQIEIDRTEIAGGRRPYGLLLAFQALLIKQHGGNSESGLLIHSLFNRLRSRLDENPRYFSELIQTSFLENTHRVQLQLYPDQELLSREEEAEKQRLRTIESHLDDTARQKIVEQSRLLKEFQKEQDALSPDCLPKVTLGDVPKRGKTFPLSSHRVGELSVEYHEAFTNGFVYADWVFSLPEIRSEELSNLALLLNLITELGSGGRNYLENLDFIQAHLNTINASLHLYPSIEDPRQLSPALVVGGSALARNNRHLCDLIRDMCTSVDFSDRERLKILLQKHITQLRLQVNSQALGYAINLSSSHFDPSSRLQNHMTGLAYYQAVKSLESRIETDLDGVLEALRDLHARIFQPLNPTLVMTCDQATFSSMARENFYGLSSLPPLTGTGWSGQLSLNSATAQGRLIPSPVSFTAKTLQTPPFTHPAAPALAIAANLFDNQTLHPEIRENGGAYGGGTRYSASAGLFSFFGYRDPNLSSTDRAFLTAIERVAAGKFDARELEEAKLEVVQKLDHPVAPGQRGALAYSWKRTGKSDALQAKFRKQLLEAPAKEVSEAVAEHLRAAFDHSTLVAFAGEEFFARENPKMSHPLPVYSLQSKEGL
ncbi:MAG: insulinase family protein, partial [Chlamydiia bacterium]|nr:insulinase family protein [Chlamydiia bacterium]